ncbi:MAG: T9SS type A sorting domain-containing protein [Thermonemataceae bacterium]
MTASLQKILCFIGIVLLPYASLFAQKPYFLPAPSENTRGGLIGGADDVGTIYYGAVPSNAGTKPVLVFIHGYTSNASTWWDGNDMYDQAFSDGYRTAFVSVHPDKSMWTNGELFASMLTTITNYYGVNRVVVVAHSKGGIDTDAALIHYGGYSKVERTITLGSPHFGTQLADLAQSGWVSWLSSVFGQNNEATFVLQTGYMNYFREETDNHPNRPLTNFTTFGTWGYGGILWFSGVYLEANSTVRNSGGNDGVVPYYSTIRPNSAVIFGEKDGRGDLNHFEVSEGNEMWRYIKAQLPSTVTRTQPPVLAATKTNPNAVVYSRSQIISSNQGGNTFFIEKNASKVKVEVFQSSLFDEIQLLDPQNKRVIGLNTTDKERSLFGGDLVKTVELSAPEAGIYEIQSQEPFVAIITTENGVNARFSSDLNDEKLTYQEGEPMHFAVSLEGATQATVTGSLIRTGSLDGTNDRSEEAFVFELSRNAAGVYIGTIPPTLRTGVYSVNVAAVGEGFERDIATSVAVTPSSQGLQDAEPIERALQVYPNPSVGKATFSFAIEEAGNHALTIYDITGKPIQSFNLSDLSVGQHEIDWELPMDLSNGLYLYELTVNGKKITKKLLLNR